MKRLLLTFATLAAVAMAACRIYDVDVYKNVNATVPGDEGHGVSQSFTCTADSLLWAEFFVGAGNLRGQYRADVLTGDGGIQAYYGVSAFCTGLSYQFIRIPLQNVAELPLIKGKQYILKITHSDGDPVNYYCDSLNPYKYGHLILPGQDQPPPHEEPYYPTDLCCRIEGINRMETRLQIADSRLQTAK